MTVLACKRDPATRADRGYALPGTGDPDGALPAEWFGPGRAAAHAARAATWSCCARRSRAETRRLIDRGPSRRMKPTAYFVNVGRGATVDEAALAQALAERRIAGAAIDVFAEEPPPAGHPFYDLDNVIVSPARLGVPAELRRPVRRAVRREPATLPRRARRS